MVLLDDPLIVGYHLQHMWSDMDFHSHREYEIYLFHAGSCRYLIHNQIYDLEPGDILLMDGMALHKPNVPPNSQYVRSTLHFSPQWISGVLDKVGGLHLLNVFEKLHHCLIRTKENQESRQLERLICRMAEIKRTSNPEDINADIELKGLLLQVLTVVNRLGQLESIKISGEKAETTEHAEKIAEYIQKNYMNKLTIDSISRELNISKSYVSHIFKKITGFTIMEYVMASRLTQAKYLLEMELDKPIKDVAYNSGFESVSHFSRYFKNNVGVSPKEYRRNRQKKYSEEN